MHMEFSFRNSVAMGEGLYGFDSTVFASQLENLRNENPRIDLINGLIQVLIHDKNM